MMRLIFLCSFISLLSCSCNRTNSSHREQASTIEKRSRAISSLQHPKAAPQPGEWLASYAEQHEPYANYMAGKPVRAGVDRPYLYVARLGAFDREAEMIFQKAKEYLSAFYLIQTREAATIPLTAVPSSAQRNNTFGLQLNSEYLLQQILPGQLPDSAFALIAFTCTDLYPREDWNFVFGQASLKDRVGVWSLARLGDFHENDSLFSLALYRTLHIAAHETGHMFGITHCVQYDCCMNGSNSLDESDRQPSWLCSNCLAKVCGNRAVDPSRHLQSMAHFWKTLGDHPAEQEYYAKACQLLPKADFQPKRK